jgi:hypothetical protein
MTEIDTKHGKIAQHSHAHARTRAHQRLCGCSSTAARFSCIGGGAIVFDGAAIVNAKAQVLLSRRRRAEAATVDAGAVRRMAAAQFT